MDGRLPIPEAMSSLLSGLYRIQAGKPAPVPVCWKETMQPGSPSES